MLYIVATPIGNLGDITHRALEILQNVSIIACENTQHTKKLLAKYNITTKCISCHSHNQKYIFKTKLLPLLQNNDGVALVSDAGTPCISDPGSAVVELAQENDIDICPIPGVSAVTSIISVAGLHGKGFHFEGFLQRKTGVRRKKLEELLALDSASILFESPYRITKLLREIQDIDASRKVLLGREITKKFEQFRKGTVSTILKEWEEASRKTPSKTKGECTLLMYPAKSPHNKSSQNKNYILAKT